MILISCEKCRKAIRVASSTPGEIEGLFFTLPEWPSALIFPDCGHHAFGCDINQVSETVMASLTIRDLTPVEAHAAMLGAGYPEEQQCQLVTVDALLKSVPVRRVVGKNIPNTNRLCLDFLELWDGTRVYFGASNQGAIIYRIAKPHTEVIHGG